ncbi:uncharacterized protein LOC141648926 [Silene latifolia]|uniref:uncharacterized protein LOC141648926 n=1 Tax=Silene latifolia TaxID=37657 RepID=UPI003D76F358
MGVCCWLFIVAAAAYSKRRRRNEEKPGMEMLLTVRMFFGGNFILSNGKTEYVGGSTQLMAGISVNQLTNGFIFKAAYNLIGTDGVPFVWKWVPSEYLAERYLETWRGDPTWKLSAFQKQIYRDLGIEVKYGLCWLARARAKLMIFGDGADQYARVWDYVAAVRKYNPGSTAIVMVDNIERPPPIFQRMYLCFKAVKDGFLAGCRPLVGVDGCHLKGAYPGMCLVAVGKDGNNNIYPIAWAVVEVENGTTWSWFLKLLVEDLGKEDGEGLTFMSDRQKGLVDALKVITPKAEVRYCVRHILANFKLQFTGQLLKDTFWSAARCTTKAEFNKHMEGMKFLSKPAHAYLAAIPPQTWSRHAFSPNCKSNLLLNNICETFNSVLKDARDKPILTHMEWIRRYVMKRHSEKREGLKSWKGTQLPYVENYLKWAENEARFGTVLEGLNYEYEVDYRGEQHAVKLKEKSCTCNHWQLTGLPYIHAISCIIKNRGNSKMYVDEVYSRATYLRAYGQSITPMPCVNQWDRVGLDEPLPPPHRKLSGRPSHKKRKKEAGEGTSKSVKRPKRQRACGNCGVLGHNTKTCKNPTLTTEKNQTQPEHQQQPMVARAKSKSEWSKKVRENIARRKAHKEMTSEMATSIIQESQASVNVLDN